MPADTPYLIFFVAPSSSGSESLDGSIYVSVSPAGKAKELIPSSIWKKIKCRSVEALASAL